MARNDATWARWWPGIGEPVPGVDTYVVTRGLGSDGRRDKNGGLNGRCNQRPMAQCYNESHRVYNSKGKTLDFYRSIGIVSCDGVKPRHQ